MDERMKKCPFKIKGTNVINLNKSVCKLQVVGMDEGKTSGLIVTTYNPIYGLCIGEDKCPIMKTSKGNYVPPVYKKKKPGDWSIKGKGFSGGCK